MPRLAVTVLLLALLAGTTAAFALTEVLKLEGSPIARPKFDVVFSPVCDCRHESARLPVKLRQRHAVEATIVDEDGNVVSVLDGPSGPVRGRILLRWDGRDERGEVVPDGPYRLRLTFGGADRTILVPNEIRIDTRPPAVDLQSAEPRRIVPGGEPIVVTARSKELARLLLFANGKRVARGPLQGAGNLRLTWDGTVTGAPLARGRYTLTVATQDRAGNVSHANPAVTIKIVRG